MKRLLIGFFFISYLLYLLSLILLPNYSFAKYTASDAVGFVDQMNKGVGAEKTDYKTFAAKIVQGGLGITGLVFFILIFYGGYLWLSSHGKEETIKQAQDTIVASIIGLIIIIGSYALTNLVFTRLVGGDTAGAPKSSGGTSGGSESEKKGPLGCCLNEAQAPGTWLDQWGSFHHWLPEITDDETCQEIGNTKTDEDEIAGEGHVYFTPGIDNFDVCAQMAEEME